MTRVAPRASDPEEQRLRELWHKYKAEMESGDTQAGYNFLRVHNELASYLWNRVQAEVDEDRRKHPKKKRNMPKSNDGPSGGRALP